MADRSRRSFRITRDAESAVVVAGRTSVGREGAGGKAVDALRAGDEQLDGDRDRAPCVGHVVVARLGVRLLSTDSFETTRERSHHPPAREWSQGIRGYRFQLRPESTSTVVEIDPETGAYSSLIDGLKTAIGVTQLPGTEGYLVLQHSSGLAPFFGGPGVVLGFASPSSATGEPDELEGYCPTSPTPEPSAERAAGTVIGLRRASPHAAARPGLPRSSGT